LFFTLVLAAAKFTEADLANRAISERFICNLPLTINHFIFIIAV
jgi:hypothetical protein